MTAVLSVLLFFTINPLFLKAETAETSSGSDIILKKLYSDEFPKIVFYIDFKEGSQIGSLDLGNSDLKIVENGKEVKNLVVEKVDSVTEPIGIVLAIDTSGSMKGEPIEAAKVATSLFIDEMRKIDKFAVIGFSEDLKVYSSFTTDRQQLKNSISQVEAIGETSLFDGIDLSIEQFKNLDIKYKYIVVLSDGMDTVSKLKYTDNIYKANKENITIFSIALLSKDYNPADLTEIAGSTGGEMLVAANTGELKELYGNISRKIRNQYKISYTSLWPNIETIESNMYMEKSGISDSITLSYNNPYFAPLPTKTVFQESAAYLKYFSIWWVKLIIYIAIFICILMFLIALILIISSPKPLLKKKTEIYGTQDSDNTSSDEDTKKEVGDPGVFKTLADGISKISSRRGFIEMFDLKLERAGLKIRGSEVMILQLVLVLLLGILVQVFIKNAFLTAGVIILIIIAPFLVINILTSKRIHIFEEQLPDTLQLISGSLQAGYSFSQAINLVVNETKPPISDEFTRIINEIRVGLPESEALENSAKRIGSSHFAWFVMAINVQREVGGNLAEIMEIIADTIRERARVTNQIKALTSEGKLSAIVLIALPLVLGIVLFVLNRAYISLLFTNNIGIAMITVAAILMIVGIIWIVKIVNVKY